MNWRFMEKYFVFPSHDGSVWSHVNMEKSTVDTVSILLLRPTEKKNLIFVLNDPEYVYSLLGVDCGNVQSRPTY